MTISNDDAARASNRTASVAAALKYLGPQRRQHCEALGDIVMAAIEAIAAAAGVKFQPGADTPADIERQFEHLGPQIQRHAERIAHTAIHVLTDVYLKTLIVASGASTDDPAPPPN